MAVAARGRVCWRRRRLKSAGAPELYLELVAHNAVPSLVGFLGHGIVDIVIDVVSLLTDLTDADVLGDHDDPPRALVATLVDNNALELLVQNLARLSEADPDEVLLPRWRRRREKRKRKKKDGRRREKRTRGEEKEEGSPPSPPPHLLAGDEEEEEKDEEEKEG